MSAIFGETLTFPQEDGPEVELVVFGDEFYSRRETLDGYTVIYDEALGQYCYARLKDGEFISSEIPMSAPSPQDLEPHLEEAEHIRRERFAQRYTQLRPLEQELSVDSDLPANPDL